jgi:hypothetical protein
MREPVFNETLQLGIVVRDLEATMRRYVDDYRTRAGGAHAHRMGCLAAGQRSTSSASSRLTR